MILPQGVDSPEALMEIVREKRQVRVQGDGPVVLFHLRCLCYYNLWHHRLTQAVLSRWCLWLKVTAHCKDVHYPMLHNVDWAGDGGCLKVGPQRGNYFSWEDSE